MLSTLVFPYSQAHDSTITLNKVSLSNELDNSRYSITLADNKSVSISKCNYKTKQIINEPISYIDNDTTPLLIRFPPYYTKLKLSISISHDLKKSLVIVKSNSDVDIESHLSSRSPSIEVSKLSYTDLPIHSAVINDSFNLEYINGKVTVSIWELDESVGTYRFLLKFSVWIDPKEVMPSLGDSNEELNPPVGSHEPTGEPGSAPATPVLDPLPPLPKRSPHVEPLREPIPEKLLRALKIGNFKKEFSFSIEDGPDFRKSIQVYNSNLYYYSKSCLKLLDELKNLQSSAASLIKIKSRCTDLIRAVLEYQFNPILKQLHVAREFETKLHLIFDPVEQNVQFIINNICSTLLITKICQNFTPPTGKDGKNRADINETLEHAKKVFETNSKEYYSWLNKYLSNEKGKTETKLLTKRKEFELSKFDYLNQLNSISNNQYMNTFLEGVFKFINLPCNQLGYLDYALYKDVRLSESLYPDKYKMYLAILSRFNSEKLKFRQLIEASTTNEELSKTLKNNSLDHGDLDSTAMDNVYVDQDNIELIFSNSMDPDSPTNLYKDADMSGILYTLGGKGKIGWHKEWIVLKNGQLMEFSDWRHGKTPINTPIEIALSNVKQINYEKRQNCFEVNTSTGNRHVFQALNAEEVSSWIKALYQAGQVVDTNRLRESLKNPQPTKSTFGANGTERRRQKLAIDTHDKPVIPGLSGDRTISPISIVSKTITEVNYLELVRAISNSDNNICLDCGSREGVEWVSINFLSVFCVECASCHRNLGSHITKIRSLKLDNFDEEVQYLLRYINNRHVNSILESNLTTVKPTMTSTPQDRLEFIKNKYVNKKYAAKMPNADNYLVKAVQKIDIPGVLEAITCGASINMSIQISIPKTQETRVISLFEYSLRKYMEIEGTVPTKRVFIVSELLLLNGCGIDNLTNVNIQDIELPDDAIDYWRDKKNKIGQLTVF